MQKGNNGDVRCKHYYFDFKIFLQVKRNFRDVSLQIETQKLDFAAKAQSKCGSKDNVQHRPGGGETKVEARVN